MVLHCCLTIWLDFSNMKTQSKSAEKTAVVYHRISIAKSGGLDSYSIQAQSEITSSFCQREGYRIIGTFSEVETGTLGDDGRPQLAKAITLAKQSKSACIF